LKYRPSGGETRVLKKGNVLFATDLAGKAILARHCQKENLSLSLLKNDT